jgi:hypothetical protein
MRHTDWSLMWVWASRLIRGSYGLRFAVQCATPHSSKLPLCCHVVQVTVYDDMHVGDHVSIVVQLSAPGLPSPNLPPAASSSSVVRSTGWRCRLLGGGVCSSRVSSACMAGHLWTGFNPCDGVTVDGGIGWVVVPGWVVEALACGSSACATPAPCLLRLATVAVGASWGKPTEAVAADRAGLAGKAV